MNVVVLSDYGKGVLTSAINGECLTSRIIQYGRENGVAVIVDPKGTDWGRYANADCVTPNTKELMEATGAQNANLDAINIDAQKLMQKHALRHILLTRSEKGMAFLEAGASPCKIPTQAKEVADVSGAGDTVIATLAACKAKGLDWVNAARIANVAAGVVVGKTGTSPITLPELRAALLRSESAAPSDLTRQNAKIFSLDNLVAFVEMWKLKGKKVVFTNGCFDILHLGHIQLMQEARAQGDKLIVAVNADSSVKRLKGETRPVNHEWARATVLAALEGVDAVIIFEEDTPKRVIETLTPDVLVKGGDYALEDIVGAQHVLAHGGKVHRANFVEGFSTTKTILSLRS